MQHYGIPTRIIDWTTNPLIALYFACKDEQQKNRDGKVFFNVKDFYISHQQSLKVSELICDVACYDIKSNLNPPLNLGVSDDDYNVIQFIYLYVIRFYELASCFGSFAIPHNDPLSKTVNVNSYQPEFIERALYLLKLMYGDKLYIDECIETKFLEFLKVTSTPYCLIDAPTVNRRIIAQNGLFQVCAGKHYHGYDNNQYPIIKGLSYKTVDADCIIIDKSAKEDISNDLDKYFNINEKTLYLKDRQELVDEFKLDIGLVKCDKCYCS